MKFPLNADVIVTFKGVSKEARVVRDCGGRSVRVIQFPDGTRKLYHVCYLSEVK